MTRSEPQSRIPGVQSIYCDESGFTGNNLLDSAQPIFVYAAVAISDDEAIEIIAEATKQMPSGLNEMKAARFLRTARGRALLAEVIKRVEQRSAVHVVNKRFALACKFFEYVFEPVLAENSGFFYSIGFHSFVANLLYIALASRDVSAESALAGFQAFIKSRDDADLRTFLGIELSSPDSPWRALSDFALAYSDKIQTELAMLRNLDDFGKWTLDVSSSTLFALLSDLGDKYEQLDVYCDDSKPLRAQSDMLNAMIGRRSEARWVIGSTNAAVTFNLAGPIKFVDSKEHAGIQIADAVASAVAYSLREEADHKSRFRELGLQDLRVLPLQPDTQKIDLRRRDVVLNAMLLGELHDRARKNRDPLDGIVDAYKKIDMLLPVDFRVQTKQFSGIAKNSVVGRKVGRNSGCPCGSGLKFKKCCA